MQWNVQEVQAVAKLVEEGAHLVIIEKRLAILTVGMLRRSVNRRCAEWRRRDKGASEERAKRNREREEQRERDKEKGTENDGERKSERFETILC